MGVKGVDVDQLKAAKQDVLKLLEEKKCGPLLIRLAWHDSGTFDTVRCYYCMRVPLASDTRCPVQHLACLPSAQTCDLSGL